MLLVLDQCRCHSSDNATLKWAGIAQNQMLPTSRGFKALQRCF